MSLARRLPAIWYGGAPIPVWLRVLVPIYSALAWLHAAPYRYRWKKPQRLPVPVIVVGNITAGGTGKTPLVIALVEALCARGHRPGVISRGYGSRAATPALLHAGSAARECGDEPVLIRQITAVPVAVGRDRVAAGRLLLAAHDCDVLIADDGLQHRRLSRDIEICVVDGNRRFGNGRLLPAGPLRERTTRLQAVDFVVCNGGSAQANEIPMHLDGASAVSLADPSLRRALHDFAGRHVHAVAGIGNPERFFATLRAAGVEGIEHAFADHHDFVPADVRFADDLPVLMTQKDAVKCREFARPNFWYLPVRAKLPDAFFDAVIDRLAARHRLAASSRPS